MANDKDNVPARPADRPSEWTEDLTVEIDCPRNAYAQFSAEKLLLRGCWQKSRLLPDEAASDEIKFLPALIPGMRISVNGRLKEGRIWDPLSLPENAGLLEQVAPTIRHIARKLYKPEPEIVRKLDDGLFKTWLYYIAKLVADGMATVTKGRLPSPEVLRNLPGKTQIECWNQGYKKRYLEDQKPEAA
jgi:hypothetical protein